MTPYNVSRISVRGYSLLWCVGVAVFLSSCVARSDGEDQDPFTATRTDAVAATFECTERANGTCNKMSCKADAQRDCEGFAVACIEQNHHYSGDSTQGTCTRKR